MKRIFAVYFLFILVFTCVKTVAFAADYSTMTDEQLKIEFAAIRNELEIRKLNIDNKKEFFNDLDISIYIDGDIIIKRSSWNDEVKLIIPVIIVNNNKRNIGLTVSDESVNGWAIDGYFENSGEVPAGKKMKCNLYFYIQNTDIVTINDFSDAEFKIRIYDKDTWRDIFISKPISIYAS